MFRWLALIAMLLVSSVASAEVIYPPGSRIGLEPPAEMEASNRFSGFENAERMASITIMELPAIAYNQAVNDLGKAELKRQGLRETIRQNFKVDGRDALLVGGEQVAGGQRIRKWIAIIGDDTSTGFLIAQAPVAKDNYTDAQMVAALKSAAFRAPLSVQQQLESLPFTIGDLAGFRIVRVISGNSVILTDGPKDNNLDGEQPVVVIGVSTGMPPDVDGREAFAKQVLASSQNLRNIVPERSEGFRLKGDEWYEIVARATDTVAARPVVVMQTIRFRGGGYVRMLAMVKAEARTGTLTRFRNIVDSIEFNS